MIEEAMIIVLKATLIFQGAFIFYLFGKYEKIPHSAKNIFFVVVNAGCLFLASGLIKNNYFLIKGGLFILIVHALIDAHFLISKYQSNKSIEKVKEKEESDVRK